MVVVVVGLVIEISRCIPRDTNELPGGLTFLTTMEEQEQIYCTRLND